jgi:predicted MPP superfamily phosphohydrolase
VLCIPLSFIVSRILDKCLARLFVVPVYVWLGFVMLLFFLVLGVDAVRGFLCIGSRITGLTCPFGDPANRLLLWRVTAGAGTGLVLLATIFSIWWGLSRLVVKRLDITLPKLPAELDGFTLVQLSDLHLDLVHGRKWLAGVVERTNALNPDLIVITGDLAEGSVAQFTDEVEPLGDLSAPHGVFFVTGNHEYFHDLNGWLEHLDGLGVRVLRNERVSIGSDGAAFDLAGIDDHEGGRIEPGHGPELEQAMDGRDPERAVVLLAHQPRAVSAASKHDVGLVLSGHTHGGQIWPFSYMVYLQQPYVRGLKVHNGTQLYISAGTGFWGPPMRLGTTAEITLMTLRAPA